MTYNNQRQENDMRVIPIGQSVNSAAQLRHLRRLIDQELDYRKEVTRYEMDGRTYLRVRLPECDCNETKVAVKKKKHSRRKPIGGTLGMAIEIVTDMLADGPQPMLAIIEAGHAKGISKRTMLRAKQALAANSRKVGKVWLWELMP